MEVLGNGLRAVPRRPGHKEAPLDGVDGVPPPPTQAVMSDVCDQPGRSRARLFRQRDGETRSKRNRRFRTNLEGRSRRRQTVTVSKAKEKAKETAQ